MQKWPPFSPKESKTHLQRAYFEAYFLSDFERGFFEGNHSLGSETCVGRQFIGTAVYFQEVFEAKLLKIDWIIHQKAHFRHQHWQIGSRADVLHPQALRMRTSLPVFHQLLKLKADDHDLRLLFLVVATLCLLMRLDVLRRFAASYGLASQPTPPSQHLKL